MFGLGKAKKDDECANPVHPFKHSSNHITYSLLDEKVSQKERSWSFRSRSTSPVFERALERNRNPLVLAHLAGGLLFIAKLERSESTFFDDSLLNKRKKRAALGLGVDKSSLLSQCRSLGA